MPLLHRLRFDVELVASAAVAVPAEAAYEMRSDPWMRRLLIGAAVCVAVTLLLFPVCKFSLASEVNAIGQISTGGRF